MLSRRTKWGPCLRSRSQKKEQRGKEQKKHDVDDVICEMALEKIVDLLENNMRRQYGDINNDTKTRRDNINRTVVSFLAHLSTKIKFVRIDENNESIPITERVKNK